MTKGRIRRLDTSRCTNTNCAKKLLVPKIELEVTNMENFRGTWRYVLFEAEVVYVKGL